MVLYRYEIERDYEWDNDSRLVLREYPVVKESEASYWIVINQWFPERKKIVRKNARKTFAYDTQKKALNNYIKRTRKYKAILTSNLAVASEWLRQAESLYDNLYT